MWERMGFLGGLVGDECRYSHRSPYLLSSKMCSASITPFIVMTVHS